MSNWIEQHNMMNQYDVEQRKVWEEGYRCSSMADKIDKMVDDNRIAYYSFIFTLKRFGFGKGYMDEVHHGSLGFWGYGKVVLLGE